ncbi:MAG: hypothetical protein E7080_06270 [Bacteroidales bacterium]|nr:hypothetical protein [Bacteroidales bacterium]
MIITDRQEIEKRIKSRTATKNERVINIDTKELEAILSCNELAAIEVEAEDLANVAVTVLREMREIGCKGTTNVVLTITCSRSYGLNVMDMEKISCVMRSFEEGTELIWGISYDNTMPMNKVRLSLIIGK